MTRTRSYTRARQITVLSTLAITLLVAAVVLAPAAQAAPKGVVGYFGSSPGLLVAKLAGEFNTPMGVAVNSNPSSPWFGDIYVVDSGNDRIQRFSSEGGFELMWGRDVIKPDPDVEVDLGDVAEICDVAPDCKDGVEGGLGGEFHTTHAVAVDQASGDVYVIEGPGSGSRVQKFTGDGEFVWMVGKDVITDGSPSDPGGVTTTQVCTVAADCKLATIGSLGGELGAGGAVASPIGGGNGVAVVPTGVVPLLNAGNVVVTDRANRRVQEFTSSGVFVRAFGWDTVTDGSPSDPGSETGFQICVVAADCKAAAAAGAGVGQFGANAPNRVAVDSTGAIYTVENSANRRVQKFTPQAGPPALDPTVVNPDIGGLSLSGTAFSSSPSDIAIGPADHVFVLRNFLAGTGTPPAPANERRVVELTDTGAFEETHAALAGMTGAIHIAVNTGSEAIYLTTSSPPSGGGIGVYVLGPPAPPPSVSLGVGSVGTHSAQLNGLVNPNGPGSAIGIRTRYHFEYREVGSPTWIPLSGDRDAGSGFSTLSATETLSGLRADTAYEAKLVAFRPFSGIPAVETPVEVFSTPASRPDIDSVSVSDRGSTSATLNAMINPNGEATSYRFEYGPTAAYGTTVPDPDGNAGDGDSSLVFSALIAGLQPDTTYHYRVTAINANGTNTSTDRTFTTLTGIVSPDDRAFELVSPPDKVGGSGLGTWYSGVESHGEAGIGAIDGDRFASEAYYGGSLADGAFSYGSDWTLGDRTPAGWVNKPFFNRIGGIGTPEFTKVVGMSSVSDDMGLMATSSATQISIFEEQPVVWGDLISSTNAAALREWETGRWEMAAPVHPDQLVGDVSTNVAPGGGHVLVAGPVRGVAGPGDPTSVAFEGDPSDWVPGNGNVYVDDVSAGLSDSFPGAGIRSLVNVCTGDGGGRTEVPFVAGGEVGAATCQSALAGRDARLVDPRGASAAQGGRTPGSISVDGSRVFFMAPDHTDGANHGPCSVSLSAGTRCPPQVYVRQRNPDGSTTVRWISRPAVAGQDADLLAGAVFEGATPDGDKAFFRTASPLTADDPNGSAPVPGGVKTGAASSASTDLYMYDLPDAPGADPGDGTLTRISAGPTGVGDANVSTDSIDSQTSALRAFSDDGRRVYFTTAAPLAGVGGAGNGTITSPGGTTGQSATRNLYVYDTSQPNDVRWRFIAQLPATTALGACAAKGGSPHGSGLSAAGGTPDIAAHPSSNCVRPHADGSLITFFSDGRLTGDDPDGVSGDVYVYDVEVDELVRVSRPQGGASGASYECVTNSLGGGLGTRCHGDLLIKATRSVYPSDGSVVFESGSRLVPGDVNDVYDVYRWHDGVLSLVSTGAVGAEDALYRGNDRSGTNIYISTRDRLTWQDHDAVLDVYAARLGSEGIPQPPLPPICELMVDGCQGSGPLPVAVAPRTGGGGDGNADGSDRRLRLSVSAVTAKARRGAVRSGVLRLAVRVSGAARVTVVARGRVGGRSRLVSRKVVGADGAGKVAVRLRLSRPARRQLRSGRAVGLSVRVSSPGAVSRSMRVRLPGAGS